MASINFYLKDSKKEETFIFLYIRVKKSTTKINTGQKVNPKYWDAGKQRIKNTKSVPSHPQINTYLSELYNIASSYLLEEKISDAPGKLASIKQKILDRTKFEDTKPVKKDDFFSLYDDFVTVSGTKLSERTIKKYKTLKKQLLDFQNKQKRKITFETIDNRFFDKLTSYYYNDLKFVNNTLLHCHWRLVFVRNW